MRSLGNDGPGRILTGCGPGRDLKAFTELGIKHARRVRGLHDMARQHSGCEVLYQILQLNLEKRTFHGIYANASIFMWPKREPPRVLGELRDALETGGFFHPTPAARTKRVASKTATACSMTSFAAWSVFMTGVGSNPLSTTTGLRACLRRAAVGREHCVGSNPNPRRIPRLIVRKGGEMNLDLMRLVREAASMMCTFFPAAGLAALGLLTMLEARATGRRYL